MKKSAPLNRRSLQIVAINCRTLTQDWILSQVDHIWQLSLFSLLGTKRMSQCLTWVHKLPACQFLSHLWSNNAHSPEVCPTQSCEEIIEEHKQQVKQTKACWSPGEKTQTRLESCLELLDLKAQNGKTFHIGTVSHNTVILNSLVLMAQYSSKSDTVISCMWTTAKQQPQASN